MNKFTIFIKNLTAILSSLLYTAFWEVIFFIILSFFVSKRASIILLLSFVVISLLSFIFINNNKVLKNLKSSFSFQNDKLSFLFKEVITKGEKYLKGIHKLSFNIFDNLNPISALAMSSPAFGMSGTIFVRDSALRLMDDYELKGVIAHEVYHACSLFLKIASVCERINFLPRFIFTTSMFLYKTLQEKSQSKKKKITIYSLKTFSYLFLIISFIFRLPYNLIMASHHIIEENYCDSFSITLGYGDGLKHVLKNHNSFKRNLFLLLFYPIHPYDKRRSKRINKKAGYEDKYLRYYFNGNIFIEHTENEKIVTIPPFIKEIGDSKRRVFSNSVNTFITNEKLQKINDYAFYNSNITNVLLHENITFIGSNAFANTKYLNEIDGFDKLLKNKIIIGKNAFYNSSFDNEEYVTKKENKNILKIDNFLVIKEGVKYVDKSIITNDIHGLYVPNSILYLDIINTNVNRIISKSTNIDFGKIKCFYNFDNYKLYLLNKAKSLYLFDDCSFPSFQEEISTIDSYNLLSCEANLNKKLDYFFLSLKENDYGVYIKKDTFSINKLQELLIFAQKNNIKKVSLLFSYQKSKDNDDFLLSAYEMIKEIKDFDISLGIELSHLDTSTLNVINENSFTNYVYFNGIDSVVESAFHKKIKKKKYILLLESDLLTLKMNNDMLNEVIKIIKNDDYEVIFSPVSFNLINLSLLTTLINNKIKIHLASCSDIYSSRETINIHNFFKQ